MPFWGLAVLCLDHPGVQAILPHMTRRTITYGLASQAHLVATDVGGIRALVEHEGNGLLVPAGDVSAIVDAVSRLWEDRDLRVRLAENGLQTAKGYGLDHLIDGMVGAMTGEPDLHQVSVRS